MKVILTTLAVIWVFSNPLKAFAVGEQHDEYTLDLKGYSPEVIEPVQVVIDRQEGRYPKAVPYREEQLIYNILNSNWINSYKPFGQDSMDPPRWPARP